MSKNKYYKIIIERDAEKAEAIPTDYLKKLPREQAVDELKLYIESLEKELIKLNSMGVMEEDYMNEKQRIISEIEVAKRYLSSFLEGEELCIDLNSDDVTLFMDFERDRINWFELTSKILRKEEADKIIRDAYKDIIEDNNKGSDSELYEETLNTIAGFTRMIELNPSDSDAYADRGAEWGQLGNYHKAIDDYNNAIEIDSNNAFAYGGRGLEYGQLGQYKKALADYNMAIEIESNISSFYFGRANILVGLNKNDKALADCNKAIEIQQGIAEYYCLRGVINIQRGEVEKAIKDNQAAIEIDSNCGKAYYNLGCIYSKQNQINRAIDYLKMAINKGIDDLELIEKDKDWDNIKDAPEFKALIDK